MKNKIVQLQQGDVVLLRISKLPGDCKPAKKDARGVVLAEGEFTGHFHGIKAMRGLALLEAPGGTRFLVNGTDEPVTITHQEHKPVTVEPGVYQVGQVREKDWFQDMVRTVRD